MPRLVERDAAALVTAGVFELARAAMVTHLSATERIDRATRAVEADRAVRRLGPLLDPYTAGEYSRFADALTIARSADPNGEAAVEAADRLDLHRQATISRAIQTPADNPGLLPAAQALPGGPERPPVPFLDALGTIDPGILASVRIPQAWSPVPVGVVNPDPNVPLELLDSQMDVTIEATDTAFGAVNVSRQLIKWGLDSLKQFDLLVDTAASVALETSLLARLTAAAGVIVPAGADLIDALDSAEVGIRWYTGPTHLVVNPDDWPAVRRAWAGAMMWPPPLAPIVTASQAAGVVLMLPASAVVVDVSPTDWARIPEVDQVGMRVGAIRYGAAGVRSPGALAAVSVQAGPLAGRQPRPPARKAGTDARE